MVSVFFNKVIYFFLIIFIIEVQLTYSVLGAEQCDSGVHTHTYYS